MAKQTRKPRMLAVVVFELGVVTCLWCSREHERRSMGESSSRNGGFWNRINVTRRHRSVAKRDVALCADKLRVLIPLIDLVVENSTFIQSRANVTSFRAATRFHLHFLRRLIGSVHGCHVVALSAVQIGMNFMSKRAR